MNMLDLYKRRGRHRIRPTEEELLKLYVNHTAKEIAEMYGVSKASVKKYIVEETLIMIQRIYKKINKIHRKNKYI